ncbi:MAG: T9SS type A sorting domain-containing protein [Bacteroidetes bacterium]|nr:T9SS type A sorting domain-containing protein [Bacteroidota bacterium]
MKRIITVCFAILCSVALFSQPSTKLVPAHLKDAAVSGISKLSYLESQNTQVPAENVHGLKIDEWTEEVIGETVYDLQSNYSSQNRLYLFEDGTIGGTWTMGFTTTSFPDRGTGYNYFDGTEWSDYPTARIEGQRSGWPSYQPFGAEGEIICSHVTAGTDGLLLNHRPVKGSGAWTEMILQGPPGNELISWPRMVTNGPDRNYIHVFSITLPVGNGGALYNGMDGALLYNRSLDGGVTWDINNVQPPETNIDYYIAYGGDYYAIAEPRGETLAFLMASKWHDLYLLKSTNNGEDWEKTIIWEHPYPFFDWDVTVTDTFYTTDGAVACAIDNYGDVHVVFGLTRVGHFEIGDTYSGFPFIDGLGYWKEGMPPFESSEPLNTMKPENLIEDVNLIGWTLDINGNGVWDVIGTVESLGNYRTGVSSMPQITIDESDNIYVLYSSVAETFQTDDQNYKHLNLRVSYDNGETWQPEIYDLTADIMHVFSECVHPVMSPTSDDYIHIIYQEDSEPGGSVQGDLDPYGDNRTPYIKVAKSELGVGTGEINKPEYLDLAGQNFPNPASTYTSISIHLLNSANVDMEVFNVTGQKVLSVNKGNLSAGVHNITLDISALPAGTYFYTVRANDEQITHKMQVK